MALIFITGNSGSGKSSIRHELQLRGHEAHDTDDDGITQWQNKTTGQATERPEDESQRTPQWYEQHEWNMARSRVEDFAHKAHDKMIFLCGSPSNADSMLELFDRVVCIVVDKDTLVKRIANRTDHDFGKAENELQDILSWHDSFQDRYRRNGAIMIDATRPLNIIVDDILNKIK